MQGGNRPKVAKPNPAIGCLHQSLVGFFIGILFMIEKFDGVKIGETVLVLEEALSLKYGFRSHA